MYSLYRAWLSLGPCGGLPTLPPLPIPSAPVNLTGATQFTGQPDVTLQVGPTLTEFSAHRSVLSNHSGFFKAALINHADPSPISVPNVNVDEFSSLLTFMYTGYLDLNLSNIYNILLATHILHMPRALEVCRNFLMQSQAIDNNRSKLIKPIPNRKSALPHQQIYPPTFSNLKKSEATPFRPINTCEKVENSQPSTSRAGIVVPEVKKDEKRSEKNKRKLDKISEKVVVDVACCDGPVRFHRVLNKNYGMINTENEYQIEKINRNDVMNKVMNENIRDKRLSDENATQSNEVFTCLYCNHTFKSQYCYQKHARRHLNPVSLDTAKTSPGISEQLPQKREVKLLDMNVQYYPCKTCGSKFPSYYFVHKHRKMCHADEMADSGNKNNEIVLENNCGNSNESSKTSVVIDVETEETK